MFGIIADGLTTVTSVLFPVFASYKAIRSSDPAQLTPWLMYWTTLSLFLAGENFFHPILSWTPFYSWIRLGVHLYLVLPGQQGSVFLYRKYLHPWLDQHEREIDELIVKSHDKAKQAGLGYINQVIELVRTKVLGLPPQQPPPPQPANVTYSQALLNRFTMPAARVGLTTGGAGDILGLLGNALQQATSGGQSRGQQEPDLAAAGNLIPSNLTGTERAAYINAQRSRLSTLLKALDTVAHEDTRSIGGPSQAAGEFEPLKKSKSEAEFVDLAAEDVPDHSKRSPSGQDAAGWGRWIWGQAKDAASQAAAAQERKVQ